MKILTTNLLLITFAFSQIGFAQIRTEEKRSTVNKSTGDTTLTESIIIYQTEDITPRRHMIIVNPLKFLLFYNLSYMQKVSSHIGVGGGIQIPTLSGLKGFGINGEIRFHASGKSPRGFYVAPNFSYNKLSENGSSESVSTFSIGALLGWQWFPGDEFAMGLGIGVDYYTASEANGGQDLTDYSGTVPALRFDIGYAW